MSTPEPWRCAVAARARGDAMVATAAPARRWLLVEQPGPWGRLALTESRLDPEVGHVLGQRATALGARAVLVRRHGRPRPGHRTWAVADARPGREGVRWGTYEHDRDLLAEPLTVLADDAAVAHDPGPAPVYLVCTHGKHDRCCAQDGRPVALALDDERPDHTWECSHLGGDRFAGNVVVLPWGTGYGHVGPEDVPALVRASDAGRVLVPLLRGRSSLLPPQQAAQQLAREATGADGVDDLRPLATTDAGAGTWHVELATSDGVVVATVRAAATRPAHHLTCAAQVPSAQRAWELVALAPAARAGTVS